MLPMSEIQTRMSHCIAYGDSLAGARVYFREDWGTYYFDLLGKQFGLMSEAVTEETFITLKNDPDKNIVLRDAFEGGIIPGYYANKKHWNSIYLGHEMVTEELLEHMILESYQFVYQKLTKSQKTTVNEGHKEG